MATHPMQPTTDELLREAFTASGPGVRHRIEAEGAAFELVIQGDRILVYRGNEGRPFATLRFGGPHSGAIWIGEQLVGEYDKDREGKFVVVDIEEGFKLPDSRRREDPVDLLVTAGLNP